MDNNKKRSLSPAYSSYKGKVRDKLVNTDIEFPIGDLVPLNSVSAGHTVIGEPASSVEEERKQLERPKGLK